MTEFYKTPDITDDKKNALSGCILQHDAGYARLVAVAPPASCQDQSTRTSVNWILRLPEVMARVGICRASIYQRMKEGTFPKSLPLGPRSVGWLEHEIDAWLQVRISERAGPML